MCILYTSVRAAMVERNKDMMTVVDKKRVSLLAETLGDVCALVLVRRLILSPRLTRPLALGYDELWSC